MIGTLEPRYHIRSHTHFAQVIPDMYLDGRTSVERLQRVSAVTVTTDGWTYHATQSYITIPAHVLNGWRLHEFVLHIRPLLTSNTGINIAEVWQNASDEWKLCSLATIPIITDSALNIDVAMRECDDLGPHIRCFAHTVNPACQKGLHVADFETFLWRIRHIVFYRSTTASEMLKAKHWTHCYIEQQGAIVSVLHDVNLRQKGKDAYFLEGDDIRLLASIMPVLRPLKLVTTLLCESSVPTISKIMPLKSHLLTFRIFCQDRPEI